MDRIIEETEEDQTMKKLQLALERGYIPKEDEMELKPFKKIMGEITTSDEGLMMKGERIILPNTLIKRALEKAHQGAHPGISRLKRRIRSHFWFPRLDHHVEKFVQACKECAIFTQKGTLEPLFHQKTPEKAWKNVQVDLFGPMPDSKHVLVAIDSMSRFPAAQLVSGTSAQPVLRALDDIYTSFGYPEEHRSDNGPPFNSKEFSEYS